MAWLEKHQSAGIVVYVIEQRKRALWERHARGKVPGVGRVRLVGEFTDEADAALAYDTRVAALLKDGYVLVDPDAGIDTVRRRGAGSPRKPDVAPRLTLDELVLRLRKQLGTLPERSPLRDAFRVLDQPMRNGATRRDLRDATERTGYQMVL